MAAPILVTKLYIPPTRAQLVQRPGLIQRLNNGLDRKLTLLSAPAGFGKTTLISHWVEKLRDIKGIDGKTIKIAWLSLDGDDNDPVRLLTYFIAALNQIQDIETALGQGALSMLQSPQPPPANNILISLINDLAAIPEKIIFVLDDYHLIEAESVLQALVFLLENLPPQLHLVIATRQDPPLSLGRLRAQAQINEIRAADLRFTASEATDFLNRVMGLNLSPGDIAELESRTEGWIAGLQLAAISMQARENRSGFIKSFTGGHRLVLDFLIEEVLGQQPENIQNFLLKTAILNKMTGSLCDAVTGQENGQNTLEMLDRANLFIVPLDEERRWYRYHHLFADLLRAQLQKAHGDQEIAQLNLRAMEWYEQNNFIFDAIYHASMNSEVELVEELIEQNYMYLMEHGEMLQLRVWTGKMRKGLIHRRPWLCLYEAFSRSWFGEIDEANKLLNEACMVIGSGEFSTSAQTMLGYHDYVKSRVTAMQGDTNQAIELCLIAREKIPPSRPDLHNEISITLGLEYFLYGDFANAKRELYETINSGNTSEAINNPVAAYTILARLNIIQGKLRKAYSLLQEAEQLIQEANDQHQGATGLIEVEFAALQYERNIKERALTHLNRGLEFLPWRGKADDLCLTYTKLARIQLALNNWAEAESAIQKATQCIQSRGVFSEARSVVETAQVKLWLVQEDWWSIDQWVATLEERFGPNELCRFEDELIRIMQARVLIAKNKPNEAIQLLSCLEKSAHQGGRQGRLIEILLLSALALQKIGETEKAYTTLANGMAMAEPEGYIRTFLDEGPPMANLLYEALSRGIAPQYVRRLLAAFPVTEPEEDAFSKSQVDQSGLIEPLSEREIEVLQLIAKGLTNQVIATRLVLSLHTIKTHTRNIYGKLAVNNRTQAVDKARTLGILPPT